MKLFKTGRITTNPKLWILGVFHTHISSPTRGKFLTQDCSNDMLFFAELHLDRCIVAPLRGQKSQIWLNIDIFGGSQTNCSSQITENLACDSAPKVCFLAWENEPTVSFTPNFTWISASHQLGGTRNHKSDRFRIFGAPLPTHSPIGGHLTCDSELHYVFAYQLLPLLVQRVVFEGRKT